MSEPWKRIEIDGQAPTVENLQVPALVSYGHYTSMQVRNRGVRGLQLHLARLREATQELYGGELDAELVRDRIRHALGDDIANASARVQVFSPDEGEHLSIMVVVSEPVEPPSATQALRSIGYLRPAATFKHVGGFGQHYYWRLASRDGFDDALLTGPDGSISETTIANIGFFDGDAVVWPDAPALLGTTMQLLDRELRGRGRSAERRTVRLPDLPSFTATFVANSHGITAVSRVDDLKLPQDDSLIKVLAEVFEAVPFDPI
jgi:branched-subunit amino acid aminotransferase/4-amino-4-deoxychorismate lyase